MPAVSKKTIVSGTSVFFIQKPPDVACENTKSIPSAGAFLRNMSPRCCCPEVSATGVKRYAVETEIRLRGRAACWREENDGD